MADVQYTDRYDALGIRPPSRLTACRAGCEGTGVRPVQFQDTGDLDADWDFRSCQDCGGTGRQRGNRAVIIARNLPRVLRQNWRFARQCLFSTQTWRKDVPHPVRFNVSLVLKILFTTR